MDVETALDFVRRNKRAVLATLRRDGTPQMSPVLVTVDGNGHVIVSTSEAAAKTTNLRRDPRAFVCVLNDGFYGDWVFIEATAEIVSLPEAMEPLVDYYRRAAGEHPDWQEYRAAMERERRVLVRLTPTRAVPTVSG